MLKFNLISLGCAKNLVDSEVMLGALTGNGWLLTETPEEAELMVLNTCGFIQPAVEEAIEEILELVKIKDRFPNKKIMVVGCLVQRYADKLLDSLPEVDLFIGTESAREIHVIAKRLLEGQVPPHIFTAERTLMDATFPRTLSTHSSRAWLKITEGCNNRCSYCMIPSIRGDLRSRAVSDLVAESIKLEGLGVKEVSLIAQDSTAYGDDLGGETNIVVLLEEVLKQTTIPWLRLLYLYPSGITDELLHLIAENKRIVPYLDIPFQHVNNRVLQGMKRRYNSDILFRLVERVRKFVPDIAIRTTFLVGFPGESEREFLEIESFLKETRIDHVGVFPYANEEGCPSENYSGQLSEEEKVRRCDHLLALQADLSKEIQRKYIGRIEPVLVEGVSTETDLLLEGRTRYQAPEVDGCVYINEGTANAGDIVMVRIDETQIYDLVGGIVPS